MDLQYSKDNYQFAFRSSSIILNKEKDKILLFKVRNRDFYLLPGGKVKEKETSLDAIKRELKEELDFVNLSFQLKHICEEIVNDKNIYYQQINLIYQTIYNIDIKNRIINCKEGDWCFFEWIKIKDIDNINIFPSNIKEILASKKINHTIEDIT